MDSFFQKVDYEKKLKKFFNPDWKVALIPFDSSSFMNKEKEGNESVDF